MADSLAYADVWISQFRSGGMTADEVAVRFAHKIVSVHPFPNGNGRWSRMVGDLLVMSLGQPRFTWAVEISSPLATLATTTFVR